MSDFIDKALSVVGNKFLMDSMLMYEAGYTSWDAWISILRQNAKMNQDYKCPCGRELEGEDYQLHHALVSKNDVKGFKDKGRRHAYIQNAFNVIALHPECHDGFSRELAAIFLCETFGEHAVKTWYYSLKWKGTFRAFPMDDF